MKKIGYERAQELINAGISVKCKVSSHEILPVTSISRLESLKNLGSLKVQGFELFEETSNLIIPDGMFPVTLDNAFRRLAEYELLYFVSISDATPVEVTSASELSQLVKSCKIRGERFGIYRLIE